MTAIIRPLQDADTGRWSMTGMPVVGASISGIERGVSVQEVGALESNGADHTHSTEFECRQCDECQQWAAKFEQKTILNSGE